MAFKKTGSVTSTEFNEGYSNLTVVGSPTISDDGIASDLSQSGYFYAPFIDFKNKSFTLKAHILFTSLSSTRNVIFGQSGTTDFQLVSLCMEGTHPRIYYSTTGISYTTATTISTFTAEVNTWYDIEIRVDLSKIILLINDAEIYSADYSGITYDIASNTSTEIGTTLNLTTWTLTGSIDLSQFSISVDGKVVYSPAPNKFTTSSYQTTSRNIYEV